MACMCAIDKAELFRQEHSLAIEPRGTLVVEVAKHGVTTAKAEIRDLERNVFNAPPLEISA